MNKTAARALDTACHTHLLLLELGAKLGIIPPVTGRPTAIQPTCAASSSPSGVQLARRHDPLPHLVQVISPAPAKPAPIASVAHAASDVAPQAKIFSYPC